MSSVAIQRTFYDDTLAEWRPPQDFPRLHGTVALDIEAYDPLFESHGPGWFTNQGFITGIALAGPDWQAYYPTRHAGGNLNETTVMRWLRDELSNPKLELVMFNRMYDEGWLRYRYDMSIQAKIFDPITAAPLLDENRFNYGLDALGDTYVGARKDRGSIKDAAKMLGIANPKKMMHRIPAPFIGPYAEQDARLTWDLVAPMKKLLGEEDLWPIYGLENRLVPVLLEMRRKGVRVNTDKAEQVGRVFEAKHKATLKKIYDLTGHHINVNDAGAIGKMLDSIGVKYPMTIKTNEPSITKTLLSKMEHPVGKLLLTARKYALAKGTFIDGTILGHAVNGVVHAQFHPQRKDDGETAGGAVTGRFSSSDPSLQNLPARDPDNTLKDEIGQAVRGCFEPWEYEEWASVDYSGQEPRLATHFAHVSRVAGVEPFVEAYRADPRMKFHAKGADICGLPYKSAKNMTLGKMYGMGGAKLCHDLKLPTVWKEGRDGKRYEAAGPEGQKIFDRYNEFMPWVKGLADLAARRAEVRGFIRTLGGRKRRFEPMYKHGAFSYKALNCLIQGSAADQMKKAMVDLYEQEKVVPLVTVHDELGFSVPSREVADTYMELMLASVTLSVPNAADLEIGPNWGDAE